jgi:hypothetical protein
MASATLADTITVGPNGINSAGLLDFDGMPLTGAGVVIGQVEPGRPGDAHVGDDLAHRNTTTNPADVFVQDIADDPPLHAARPTPAPENRLHSGTRMSLCRLTVLQNSTTFEIALQWIGELW